MQTQLHHVEQIFSIRVAPTHSRPMLGTFWGLSAHFTSCDMWGVPQMGIEVPPNRWFIIENPTKMDDLGVPLFQETIMSPRTCLDTLFPIWVQKKREKHIITYPNIHQYPSISQYIPISHVLKLWLFAREFGDRWITLHRYNMIQPSDVIRDAMGINWGTVQNNQIISNLWFKQWAPKQVATKSTKMRLEETKHRRTYFQFRVVTALKPLWNCAKFVNR